MNLVILIEQSYIDSNIKKHLIRSFLLKHKLIYQNQAYGGVVGNIGCFIGSYTELEFQQGIQPILDDLEKYHPFLKFIGLNFKKYWVSKQQLKELLPLNLTKSAQLEVTTGYFSPFSSIDQAMNLGIRSLIYLLTYRNDSTN